jgi:hypothetical protein
LTASLWFRLILNGVVRLIDLMTGVWSTGESKWLTKPGPGVRRARVSLVRMRRSSLLSNRIGCGAFGLWLGVDANYVRGADPLVLEFKNGFVLQVGGIGGRAHRLLRPTQPEYALELLVLERT